MNFQRQREYVTQYAMGKPISKRMPETQQASLKVSAMACQFIQEGVFADIFSLKRKRGTAGKSADDWGLQPLHSANFARASLTRRLKALKRRERQDVRRGRKDLQLSFFLVV